MDVDGAAASAPAGDGWEYGGAPTGGAAGAADMATDGAAAGGAAARPLWLRVPFS